MRGTQEVETVTGHVRREATSCADATSMYAANPMHTRRETGETRKEKSAPKELDNCGHIEGLWFDDDCADHPTLIVRIAVEDTVIDEGARRAERYTLRLAWLQISRIERLIYGCRRVCGGSCIHPGDGGADLHLEILRSKLEFLHHH